MPSPRAPAGRHGEAGFFTVMAVMWMAVTAFVAWLGLVVSVIVAGQHHADGAADLVAVSAALRLQHGDDPCATASRLAAANDVDLISCSASGMRVMVEVSERLDLPFAISGHLRAVALAGPG